MDCPHTDCAFRPNYLNTRVTAANRALLEKLTVPQLVKKLYELYGNRTFITTITTARNFSPTLIKMNPVHNFPSYFFKIHFKPSIYT